MVSHTCEADDRDLLIDLAIYDFHAAIERGESPDLNQWEARNPELAPEIHAYFECLVRLELLVPPSPAFPEHPATPWHGTSPFKVLAPDGTFGPDDLLGGYRLLRILGGEVRASFGWPFLGTCQISSWL